MEGLSKEAAYREMLYKEAIGGRKKLAVKGYRLFQNLLTGAKNLKDKPLVAKGKELVGRLRTPTSATTIERNLGNGKRVFISAPPVASEKTLGKAKKILTHPATVGLSTLPFAVWGASALPNSSDEAPKQPGGAGNKDTRKPGKKKLTPEQQQRFKEIKDCLKHKFNIKVP